MLALQGNAHELEAAIALAVVVVLFRHAILRTVLGAVAVVALAAFVVGAAMLAQAIHL